MPHTERPSMRSTVTRRSNSSMSPLGSPAELTAESRGPVESLMRVTFHRNNDLADGAPGGKIVQRGRGTFQADHAIDYRPNSVSEHREQLGVGGLYLARTALRIGRAPRQAHDRNIGRGQ